MSNPLLLEPHPAVRELVNFLNDNLRCNVDNLCHFDMAWDHLCGGAVNDDLEVDYLIAQGFVESVRELDEIFDGTKPDRYPDYLDARQNIATEAVNSLMVKWFKVDLDKVEWQPKQFHWDYDLHEFMDCGMLYLDLDWDNDCCHLIVKLNHNGMFYRSARPKDWPVLDALFGREQWQAYLDGLRPDDVEVV